MFFKIGVLKNYANFIPCDGVFFLIKLQSRAYNFKKRLQHRCFPVNFVKLLKTPSVTEHLQWLLLKNGLQWKHETSPIYNTKVTGLQRKKLENKPMT